MSDVRAPVAAPGAAARRVVAGSLWSLGVVLVAALVLLLNYFGMKYYQRFDWTGEKVYSLSDKSRAVVDGLDRDVEVTLMLRPDSPLAETARELLERYAARSPRLTLRQVDPERNLIEAARLKERFALADLNVVVFEAQGERRIVDTAALAEWDYSALQYGGQPTMTGFKGEAAFTGALLELVSGERPVVRFTSGHGERAIDDPAVGGLTQLRELLAGENAELESWPSLGETAVPEGTALLVIAGPKVAFLPPEVEVLGRYLDAGGRLLVLLDPELDPRGGLVPTGLEALLAGRGVEVGDDLVVDPAATLPTYGAETIQVRAVGGHPIVDDLAQAMFLPVIVNLARSVRPGVAPEGMEARPLLETTSEGWGETDLAALTAVEYGEGDRPGPVAVGVAVGAAAPGPPGFDAEDLHAEDLEADAPAASEAPASPAWRLVVLGDSDVAANGQVALVGNPTLVGNAFNWLLEREQLLGIAAKRPEQARLSLTRGQLSAITWGVLAGLPGLALAAGVVVWARRRK